MKGNTDGVNQEAENHNSMKMIDFSLWESRSKAVNDFIIYYSFDKTAFVLISLLGFLLVISALLGHGFYIWHFKTSNEQTQSRLLNILNSYLSAVCMSGSIAVFNLILQNQMIKQKSTTKIYYKDLPNTELLENEQMSAIRVTVTHAIAISVLFLLI